MHTLDLRHATLVQQEGRREPGIRVIDADGQHVASVLPDKDGFYRKADPALAEVEASWMQPRYYECDICGYIHPWNWNGDCRDNANRFQLETLEAAHGKNGFDLATMDERVEADNGPH